MLKTAIEKIIAGIFIASLLISVVTGYLYWQEQRTTKKLSVDLDTLSGKIAEMKEQERLRSESDKIDKESLAEIPVKIEKIFIEKETLDKKTANKLVTINDKYKTLPSTDENKEARQKEVSKLRIDALWASYCTAITGESVCPPESAKKEKQ